MPGEHIYVRPQINGRMTIQHYMAHVNLNLEKGRIMRPDPSRIRIVPTSDEMREYERNICSALKLSGKPSVDADVLYSAARRAASRSDNTGSANYVWGLRPGSDDPIHYGHISAGLASIIFLNSIGIPMNGAVFATGGKVPDKPEISAFIHREAMANLALREFDPWIQPTSIRNITAENFGNKKVIINGSKQFLMGATPELRRAFCDIAAFDWLFAMNPDMKWYYITGSDKVNKYGKTNEKELIHNTLFKNGVKVIYFERDDEPVDPKCVALQPWFQQIWDNGMFVKSEVSSYSGLTATKLRKMIITGDEKASDEVFPGVVKYALDNGLLELYKLNDSVKSGVLTRESDEYKKTIAYLREKGIID